MRRIWAWISSKWKRLFRLTRIRSTFRIGTASRKRTRGTSSEWIIENTGEEVSLTVPSGSSWVLPDDFRAVAEQDYMNVGGTFHLWLFVLALDMVKDYPNRTERVLNFTCDDHVMSHQNIINAYLALVYPDSYVRVEFIEVDRLRTCINVTEHSLSAHVECSNQDVANANAKLLYRYKAYAYYKEERAKQRPKKIGVIKPGYQPSTITWIYPEFDI